MKDVSKIKLPQALAGPGVVSRVLVAGFSPLFVRSFSYCLNSRISGRLWVISMQSSTLAMRTRVTFWWHVCSPTRHTHWFPLLCLASTAEACARIWWQRYEFLIFLGAGMVAVVLATRKDSSAHQFRVIMIKKSRSHRAVALLITLSLPVPASSPEMVQLSRTAKRQCFERSYNVYELSPRTKLILGSSMSLPRLNEQIFRPRYFLTALGGGKHFYRS